MAKGVKILERKFCDIEKRLSGFIAFVDTFVEDDKEVLSFKLSQFDRLNAKYESVKEEIFSSLSDGEFQNFDGKITTCNEHIEKLEVRLKSLNLKYSKNNNETGSNAVSNVIKPCFRLPELSLPQFNGDIETWFIFKEQFKEIIENCGLNDKQKLQYLQSCLIGIAKHVQTVDDTYDSLFLALEQRFENKRLIINKHINALLMLKYEKFRGDSNVELRNLVDTCTKHLRALKLLNIEHNTFSELLLIQLVMQVLDTETKRLFEMTLESTDIPKWDDFLAFLNKRCLFLENLPSAGTKGKQNFKDSPRHKSFILHTDANVDKKCKLCSLNHDLYNCDKFKNVPVRERYNIVKSLNLCLKCLKPNHKVSQCRSKHICFCKKNHNQLLHFVNVKNQEMQNFESSQPDTRRQDDVIEPICFQNSSIKNNQNKTDRNSFNFPSTQSNIVQGQVSGVNMSISASQKHKNDIILSTCIIYVENSVGEKVPLRVLADSGSQVSLLSSSTADFLNLRKLKTDMSVSGLGGSNVNIKSKIKGVISNGSGSYKRVVDFHVVPKITNMIPVNSFDISHIVFPSNVHLADPTFNTSNSIDALLSADIFFDILKDGKYKLDNGNLILQNTEFGYIISGNTSRFSSGSLHCGLITKDFENLNDTLKSFWEIEEIVPTKFVSDELKKCDEHFLKTMARDTNGRFCVEMPMKDNDIELGQSKSTAICRLELLKDVPTENKEFLFNENDELVKTLGLSWRPREDTFMYQMNLQEVPVTITKRTVLSFISKLYDPLGLLQPIIIKAKMMIQKIWLLKIDWDQNLPREEIENFQRYVAELHQLKDLKIPRCILLKDSVTVQLIGFADASAQAYGACLYLCIL
ncbi:integrase catalytic domain-containing protein [Trichonephila clavata]|uniref:Integrase catalytic domain-containing protein n=1 Tax=Trichonephila clavata TaxID=2740835 RepID=A0A8X6LZF1_TRICU|nr:integrase catalytic domain-containing protein [Trichonephila clavata]